VTEGRPEISRRNPLLYIGGLALLLAMTVDASGVIARHLGRALRGSIELVQAAILIASSCAVVMSTLARRHAKVHLLMNRVSPSMQAIARRLGNALGGIFFALLAVGGLWIASDLWSGHEESELLHIPYAPLRIVAIGAMLGAAAVLIIHCGSRKRP
jgi:TRAP-type transport system small permease protein